MRAASLPRGGLTDHRNTALLLTEHRNTALLLTEHRNTAFLLTEHRNTGFLLTEHRIPALPDTEMQVGCSQNTELLLTALLTALTGTAFPPHRPCPRCVSTTTMCSSFNALLQDSFPITVLPLTTSLVPDGTIIH